MLSTAVNMVLPLVSGDNDVDKLDMLTQAHPWYAMPWLAKAKATGKIEDAQRAAIFISNPLWMHWILTQPFDPVFTEAAAASTSIEVDSPTEDTMDKLAQQPQTPDDVPPTTNLDLLQEIATPPQESQWLEREEDTTAAGLELDTAPNVTQRLEQQYAEAYTESEGSSVDTILEEVEQVQEAEPRNADLQASDPATETPLIANVAPTDASDEPITASTTTTGESIAAIAEIQSIEADAATTLTGASVTAIEPVDPPAFAPTLWNPTDEPETPAAEKDLAEDAPMDADTIPNLPPLTISQHASAESNTLFTPYHLVDYFASQGIKLNLADLPKTSFDKKVMSFTQWLKTMKKVNFETQIANTGADALVDATAKASLAKEDVLTEAMAQVLVQQGKKNLAIQLYLKLMLLHPEKSTFFAAQIHELNTSI